MFDKIRYALTLFDNTEILIILAGLVVYHAVILLCMILAVRSSSALRLRSLQAERDEYRKNWEHRSEGWKDREDRGDTYQIVPAVDTEAAGRVKDKDQIVLTGEVSKCEFT